MNKYYIDLVKQRNNILFDSGLRAYFESLYSELSDELKNAELILEVGAGAGVSEIFLNQKILRTDLFSFPEFGVLGDSPMENLPFKDDSFDLVFAMDAIHHSIFPLDALSECLRVISKGGTVLLVEPYVSFLSYIPYKLFHHEDTSWRYKNEESISSSSYQKDPSSGNQGISKFLIAKLGDTGENKLQFTSFGIKFISPFSFFATGGVARTLKTPKLIICFLVRLESKIPQIIMRFLASRVVISIKK
jgi:SAM-dependent methyltransferase